MLHTEGSFVIDVALFYFGTLCAETSVKYGASAVVHRAGAGAEANRVMFTTSIPSGC